VTRAQVKPPAAWHPSRRLWRAYFNAALYVPPELCPSLRILESRGRDAFVAELERLSSLGSPSACALLGMLCLTPDSGGTRDPKRAMELCKSHADAGHAYAQFVYAWAQMLTQRGTPAVATMNKAATHLFPPATIALGTFLLSTSGADPRQAEAARKVIGLAARSGHTSALLLRCSFYRSGRFGIWKRLLGVLLTPIAFVRPVFSTLFVDPFSARVFSFPMRLKESLIRAEPKFSLYNKLEETPELYKRRRLDRYLLLLAHLSAAVGAVLGGHIFRRPGAEPLHAWTTGALIFPYFASATYSVRVVCRERIRLALFVLLLGAGATLTGAFVSGALTSVDSFTAVLDIAGLELFVFIWTAEFFLDAP
jgi:hypothetical protein